MDKISFTLKPIYWRLLIWRFFPYLIVIPITMAIIEVTPKLSLTRVFLTDLLFSYLGFLTVQVSVSFLELFSKNWDIEVAEGKIIGSKPSIFSRRQTFLLKELEKNSLFNAKPNWNFWKTYKLYSSRGETITFIPFIYENPLADEFYETMKHIQQENLKTKKQIKINWREK